ncbi:hypothetical protein [Polyangium sp. 15x6]|uniref:hypothetical protein n=1 Tax=Polyangium sp. 15x6 TaxID=3042687 RepID=UPI00249C489B|nr:hypothetical protein [Polyangium sp. 15x6]MDI3286062.1 hypothetical protein [Polyangium sp. 15x6]
MPYKSLSAPRRVESLDADVRGVAAIDNPGLVAMVSAAPARLAVVPIGSGTNKTVNLSLGQGDEVAMLSRDVALVRSENEVWAVLDIHHRAKLERVAGDVRSLRGRSSGEHALALTWDGNAIQLSVSGNEVEARPFVLRGNVKAADLGAADTTVVVEVSGGLELRMHPGPTPEPGANGRVNLPAEAKKFDRLNSGTAQHVLYKKGDSAACIVTQRGGRLAAKMVDIGVPITCAAVSETSLVVGFADGRAALFDGATLDAAGGGPMTPTHSLSLGARGEPTTMLVTNKGSAWVWVGTSGGEVVRVSLPRK